MEPQIQSWVGVVAQVGFPIVVAGYVLLRLEKIMLRNLEALVRIEAFIKTLTGENPE